MQHQYNTQLDSYLTAMKMLAKPSEYVNWGRRLTRNASRRPPVP